MELLSSRRRLHGEWRKHQSKWHLADDIYGAPIAAVGVLLFAVGWVFLVYHAAGSRVWAMIGLVLPSVVLIPLAVVSLVTFARYVHQYVRR